jgi:hypothetical protein
LIISQFGQGELKLFFNEKNAIFSKWRKILKFLKKKTKFR